MAVVHLVASCFTPEPVSWVRGTGVKTRCFFELSLGAGPLLKWPNRHPQRVFLMMVEGQGF